MNGREETNSSSPGRPDANLFQQESQGVATFFTDFRKGLITAHQLQDKITGKFAQAQARIEELKVVQAQLRVENTQLQIGATISDAKADQHKKEASEDPLLKGFLTRKHFFIEFSEIVAKANSRQGDPNFKESALLILDLNDFKVPNDTYGHLFGDTVLRRVGEILHKVVRQDDIFGRGRTDLGKDIPEEERGAEKRHRLGRYGGDELVIGLDNIDQEGVEKIIERLHQSLSESPLDTPDGNRYIQSASIGFAMIPPGATTEKVFAAADQHLYEKKRQYHENVADKQA